MLRTVRRDLVHRGEILVDLPLGYPPREELEPLSAVAEVQHHVLEEPPDHPLFCFLREFHRTIVVGHETGQVVQNPQRDQDNDGGRDDYASNKLSPGHTGTGNQSLSSTFQYAASRNCFHVAYLSLVSRSVIAGGRLG